MTTPVERLDLAPRLKRPLQLWNPLDYLRLLYWAFFFPQAIRWYIETFAIPSRQKAKGRNLLPTLRHDPVQRNLVLQSLITLILGTVGLFWLMQTLRLPISWVFMVTGVALGVMSIIGGSVTDGVSDGVALGVTVGLAIVVTMVVVFGLTDGVAIGVTVVVVASMVGGVTAGVRDGMPDGKIIIVAFGRLLDWLIGWFPARMGRHWGAGGRLVWLPLPGLQRHLAVQLQADWELGVDNLNEFLRFTLQFIPVVGALNDALTQTPQHQLLSRIAYLTDQPWDWKLLQFGTVQLRHQLGHDVLDHYGDKILIPEHVKTVLYTHYPTGLRLDTPARAACAGFWLWHKEDAVDAVDAFEQVKDLPHGPEIYQTALALRTGLAAKDSAQIAAWLDGVTWLEALPDPELRPGTLAALRTLRDVADNARRARQAHAPLTRSLALNQANAALTRLLETGAESCPQPEWPLLKTIAAHWRDILTLGGGELSEAVLRQPVDNPYKGYSGLPLIGSSFVGRDRIFRQIETLWSGGQLTPPLVLFGHRRMGKSSILRQLAAALPRHNLLVYLDMQDSSFVEHTGELLFDLAQAVQRTVAVAGLNVGPPPTSADYPSLGPARLALNALWQRVDAALSPAQRLILAIDEFDVIQDGIDAGRVEAGVLEYLRAINQRYPWLNLIFAGLHTLDELGRDYQSIFYGQAKHLRVGYLNREDALALITRPSDDFSLEYDPELIDELFHLTYGQPYLLQHLCWELVNRWNERFLAQGETVPRQLTLADLEPVLTPDLYHAAGYYFDGVWRNITPAEQALLRVMAPHAGRSFTSIALVSATGLNPIDVDEAIDLLLRHDVVTRDADGLRIASELMRRWIIFTELGEKTDEPAPPFIVS